MSTKKYVKQVRELLVEKNKEGLDDLLKILKISTVADVLTKVTKKEQTILFRHLPARNLSRVFSRLTPKQRIAWISSLDDEEKQKLLRSLKPDERVKLLTKVPKRVSKQLLKLLEPEDLAEAKKLLSYPKSSVGRLMTPDFIAVKKDWDILHVLEHIRARAKESETINVVYVVGDDWQLIGQLDLQRIILASPEDKVSSLLDKSTAPLKVKDDQEKAVRYMNEHRLIAMPVIEDDSLVGIVTFDDLIEVANAEATEDMQKGSAIIPLNVSYKSAGVSQLFRKRFGWLLALVVISLVSSGVLAKFEDTLSSAIALTFFIPLLIGSGGNAGAQAATLMIRAISMGELKSRDWLKAAGKEMMVGASLAFGLGVFSSAMGFFRGGSHIGIIVGLSMAAIICMTNILGTLLPFLLYRLRIDPAVASGPLVTSVADIIGLSIYLSIASVILSGV